MVLLLNCGKCGSRISPSEPVKAVNDMILGECCYAGKSKGTLTTKYYGNIILPFHEVFPRAFEMQTYLETKGFLPIYDHAWKKNWIAYHRSDINLYILIRVEVQTGAISNWVYARHVGAINAATWKDGNLDLPSLEKYLKDLGI